MHDLPPKGSIEGVFPPRLIASLHVMEFEGMLRLAAPDAIRVLYFRKGEIASAASNAEPDRLANILVTEGRLTAQQLELARSRLQAGASLGKALIEMGFLSPSELLQGARHQVKVIVSSCFAARTGDYEMIPGPLPPEVTSLGLNTRRLLFDGLLDSGDRASVIREVGSMESVYRPTDRLEAILASLRLDVESDRIGRHLDGNASLREISGRTSRDDFTVSKVALALELLGAAENLSPVEEQAAAADPGQEIPIITEAPSEPDAGESIDIEVETPDSVTSEQDSAAQPFVEPPAASAPIAIAGPDAEEVGYPAPQTAPAPDEAIDQVPFAAAPAEALSAEPLPTEPLPAEPPPIPQEELPAFAQVAVEPSAEPQPAPESDGEPTWQIDPETGERVHAGPIEMTFDGRIARSTGEPRNLMWFLLAAGAITLVVGGSLGYVFLRRGAGGPEERTAAVSGNSSAGRPEGAEARPSGGAVAAVPDRPVPTEAAPVATPALVTRAPEKPAPETRAAAPEAPPAAKPPIPTGASATVQARGPAAGPDFTAGLRRLDQGDAAGAARQFEEWIGSQDSHRFALQILIACQEETVKKARAQAAGSSSLFILPYALKERSCYRVCWGVYDDVESARAAIPSIPSALTGKTAPPIVPLSRLRRAG